MEMVCPDCGLTRWYETLPMRLQTCPRCRAQGSGTYLKAPNMEVRMPIPERFASRTLEEKRRLVTQLPQPVEDPHATPGHAREKSTG